MRHIHGGRLAARLALAGAVAGGAVAVPAATLPVQAAAPSVTIGVDHVDPANQQPQNGRLYEYTDFFSRQVTVHRGEVIDFQFAPGAFHTVSLATDEQAARHAYPVGFGDRDDPRGINGSVKLVNGPGQFAIEHGTIQGQGHISLQGPRCGVPQFGQNACTFDGGNQVQSSGGIAGFGPQGPTPLDYRVRIDATPGTYHYFCYIHPGMSGTLQVVPDNQPATTQAQINRASGAQFRADRASGMAAESAANHLRWTGGAPGSRTYIVDVGVESANGKVAIDEMLPHMPIPLKRGDSIHYVWTDHHNVHSVQFPTQGQDRIPAVVADCGPVGTTNHCTEPGEAWENRVGIFDPGNAAPWAPLRNPNATQDSGVLVGTGYGIAGATQSWAVSSNHNTQTGTYVWHCTIHDFMVGVAQVSA